MPITYSVNRSSSRNGSKRIIAIALSFPSRLSGFFRPIVRREERDQLVFSFLRQGLRSGEKCLCAVEATDRDALLAEVSAQVEVSTGDQLYIVLSREIYRERGDFSVPDMIDYWESWLAVGSPLPVRSAR